MKKPTKRCRFLNENDELNYLNELVRFLHSIGDGVKLAPCVRRMEDLLNKRGTDDGSIMLQDHWAVLHEVRGDFQAAIDYRTREVTLIEYLLTLGPLDPPLAPFLEEVMRVLADDYLQLGDRRMEQQLRRRLEAISVSRSATTADGGDAEPVNETLHLCPAGKHRSRSNDEVSEANSCRKRNRRRNTDQG